jgi:hypothetical protein
MIKIIINDDGRHAPQAFCDHCGERIEQARDGNYEWHPGNIEPGDEVEVYLIHKRCTQAFQQATGKHPYTGELTVFPVYLGNNLEIDWDEANEMVRRSAALP